MYFQLMFKVTDVFEYVKGAASHIPLLLYAIRRIKEKMKKEDSRICTSNPTEVVHFIFSVLIKRCDRVIIIQDTKYTHKNTLSNTVYFSLLFELRCENP